MIRGPLLRRISGRAIWSSFALSIEVSKTLIQVVESPVHVLNS